TTDVTVPAGTTNFIVVNSSVAAKNFTVLTGAPVTINSGNTLTVNGNIDVSGAMGGTGSIVAGGAGTIRGNLNNLVVAGSYTLAGTTTASSISFNGGSLTVAQPISSAGAIQNNGGTLTVQSGGVLTGTSLTLANSANFSQTGGSITVSGAATFSGAATTG